MVYKFNVVLFGASHLGQKALSILRDNENIKYFCDNDKQKWGKRIEGILIVSPNDLKNIGNVKIIITSMYYEVIIEQLKCMGFDNIWIYNDQTEKVKKVYKYITNDRDYTHLQDRKKYKALYEEVGEVEANKVVVWREEWMKHFKPTPNSRILELGAHNGPNLIYYARKGHEVLGVEISENLISIFNKHKSFEDKDVQNRITMINSWIEDYKPSDKYDYVLCTEILEHVVNPIDILLTAKQALKNDGFIYITSPTIHWGNNTHVRGVGVDELKKWLEEAGLVEKTIFEENDRIFCYAQIK